VQRETGTIFLPHRRRIPVAALARTCGAPWHPWPRGALARAERTADGRVHLLVLRARPGGVALAVRGVRAAEAEVLAPLAARVRRALDAVAHGRIGGTSPFEDAVGGVLDDAPDPPGARRRLARLGTPCPAAPRLRTMPGPLEILACSRAALARALGSTAIAARLQALARAFAAITPCEPIRS